MTSPSHPHKAEDASSLTRLGATSREAARFTESDDAGGIDPKQLADRLDALGRDRKLDELEKRNGALALFKEADAAAVAQARARLKAGTPGLNVARGLSAARDVIVDMVFRFTRAYGVHPESATEAEAMGIAAVGGYGRDTLAPYSDIDLLIIHPYKRTPWAESVAEYMMYLLWDMGLKVGHATRSIDDCVRLARQDVTIKTSLLEARYVTGSRELVDELKSRFWTEIASGTGADFVTEKLAERDKRHNRTGVSRYMVEPNLKDGKGGLRDLHTLFWIAKYLYQVEQSSDLVDTDLLTASEFNMFKRAEAFLWDVRCHLHFLAGRGEERLTFDRQTQLAEILGYTDQPGLPAVEAFMKNYFLVAKDVGDLTRIICAGLELRQQKVGTRLTRFLPGFGAKNLGAPGFVLDHGRIDAASISLFQDDPVNILRLFHLSDDKQVLIHPRTLRLITQSLHLIDDDLRNDPEANRLFLQMLSSPRDPERILRRMNEAGVLGLFVPDFGRIVARMQFNMYHHFTVDEHLIRAVAELAAIEQGRLEDEVPTAKKMLELVSNRSLIYVAVFLHDIAKGRPQNHSDAGAEVAEDLGPRFGLTKAETTTVAWLVRHHLIMSMVAQKRDISDPKTIQDFAEFVQSPERLRLLYLLTVVDIRAVGPGTWNAWKGQLLQSLYDETLSVLPGGSGKAGRKERIDAAREALRDHLRPWKEEALERAIARHADAYWLSMDTDAQARQAHLLRDADARREADEPAIAFEANTVPDQGATEITVIAPDRAGLFAALTGAIASSGGNVLEAKIFTTNDGLALDVFLVQGPNGLPIEDKQGLGRLRTKVLAAAVQDEGEGSAVPRPMLKSRERVFEVESMVSFDHAGSETYTIIEVNGRDRVGLLSDIAQGFADLRLSVGSAHISTFGESAVDVFYVRDRFGLKLEAGSHLGRITDTLIETAG